MTKKYIIVSEDMRGLGLAMQEINRNDSEVLIAIIPPEGEADKAKPINAAIEVDGKIFDGYSHDDAIARAEDYGCDCSKIDKEKDGLFRLSDGSIITREQCIEKFSIHSADEIADDEKNLWKNGSGIVVVYPLEVLFEDREDFKDYYWIFDSNHGWEYGEELISDGFKVFGGTEFTYKLEEDRGFGIDFAESCGLNSPEQSDFKSKEEGLRFLETNEDKAYVYKPNNQDCAYTTVPSSANADEANIEIRRCIKSFGFNDFLLQERVKGIEACTEVWFANGVPLRAFVDLEDKLSHSGGMGAPAGCHFDLNWEVPLDSPIIKKTVGKMFDKLTDMKFTGLADCNVIFSDFDNIWFLEYCFRLGFNAFATVAMNLTDKTGLETLSELVDDNFDTQFKKGFGASINVNAELYKDSLPITIPKNLKDKVYLFEARVDEESEEEDDMVMCGISKEVAIVMGHDYTPATAIQEAMNNASKVKSGSRSYYRNDADSTTIPNSIVRRYEALVQMGLLS